MSKGFSLIEVLVAFALAGAVVFFAPSGITPYSTKRHSAMSRRLASATIPMRRDRPLPWPKRCMYHFVKALPGW